MKNKYPLVISLLAAVLITAGLVAAAAAASGSPAVVSASLSVTYDAGDGEKELVLYPSVENTSLPLHFEVTDRGALIDSAAVHMVYADNSTALAAWDKEKGKEWNNRSNGTSATWHWTLNSDGDLVLISSGS